MKFLKQKDELFIILKEIPKQRVSDYRLIQKKLNCDLVIRDKSDTVFYFVNHIPSVDIIEEINE